jgi:Na+-translocating ferredoxin:NAD+ oxidoreductase RnfA subunit
MGMGAVGFVVATAALALWVVARWPWHPPSIGGVVMHACLALAVLQLSFVMVQSDSPPWWRFVGLLIVVGPALVYTWLAGAWAALLAKR